MPTEAAARKRRRRDDDVLAAAVKVFHRRGHDVDAILDEVMAMDGVDPLQRLEVYVRRQVAYNLTHFERISVYYHDFERLSPEHLAALAEGRRKHEKAVTQLIEGAQRDGAADPSLDARLLRNCVFATVIWTYRWYRPNGRASRDAIADVCSRFALRGVVGQAAG